MKIAEETKEKVNEAKHSSRDATRELKFASKRAWDDFSNYSLEKKEEAIDFLNKEMSVLDQKIAQLREESGDAADDSVSALKEKRADLKLQVEKTKNATGETWSELKLETQKKWNSFNESLQEMANKITGS